VFTLASICWLFFYLYLAIHALILIHQNLPFHTENHLGDILESYSNFLDPMVNVAYFSLSTIWLNCHQQVKQEPNENWISAFKEMTQ
jgi:hypothetical protein